LSLPQPDVTNEPICCCPRCSAKEIKVAKVDSRILSGGGRIKMVGHIRHSSDQRQLCSDIRRLECEDLTTFAAEFLKIREVFAQIRGLRWKTEYLKRHVVNGYSKPQGLEAELPKLAFYPLKQGRIQKLIVQAKDIVKSDDPDRRIFDRRHNH